MPLDKEIHCINGVTTRMIELTILMPCLNEAETLEACIIKAKSFIERSGIDAEILISDNGSTDGSQALAQGLGARVIDAPERGYGAALIAGIKEAEGRFVIMGDSDDSYDFSKLELFVQKLRAGDDLVMGNRMTGGIEKNAMPPLHRYLGNPVLSAIGRILYRTPVGDFHCGLRGFNREAILRLRLNSNGMDFASEMVIKASLFGLKISEVPTTLSPDGRSRPPHLRSWRDGWLHLKLLLTLAPSWLFLYPGLAIAGLGAVGFTRLLFGPLNISGVSFDAASLIFFSAMVVLGGQMLWFYLLAKLFAVRTNVLPSTPGFERVRRYVSVDNSCRIGALFLLISALAFFVVFAYWARQSFGDLNPSTVVRGATLSVTLAAVGVQFITSGFLWGMLEQKFSFLQKNDCIQE